MDMDLDLPGRSPALESQAKCLSGSLASPSYQPSHSRSDAHGEYSPSQRPKKSTSTCSTCRFRKVRCNGARPLCSNCKRLGFPCSYEDSDVDNWSMALPRRRVKQACLNCHSRKARCSGHVPTCDRCRAQGLDCVYRPGKRSRLSVTGRDSVDIRSPDRHNGDHFDRFGDRGADCHDDSETPVSDPAATNTPSTYNHEIPGLDETLESLIERTLDKFFHHVHHIPMFSFLHRASLMEQYNAGKVDKSLLLALIGITSCLTNMGSGVREYGDRCIDRAESLIFGDYKRPSTFKVQALVLMIKHRILSNRYPSAFMLLSIASRFAAALRLNHPSTNLCFLAQESRRRLMWSLYCIDAGISAGYRDFALWRADRIFVSLPCNERNFEFDLPQPAEMLDPECNGPDVLHPEDVGSLALHIRILHLRQGIIEFTKDVLSREIDSTTSLQEPVLAFHKKLDDFANRLPASFQFSESSLRLRAYSPRICVFVMIHVWWHQCHCDLYRMTMAGFREALPEAKLQNLDPSFLEHCRKQCVDNSLAMASIFASMQKLGAKPVADLDLALCAYQCARMLKYALHGGGEKFGLTSDAVAEKAKVCLQAIKQCCMGPAAAAIRSDLERLINQGLGSDVSSPKGSGGDQDALGAGDSSDHPVLRDIELTEEPTAISTTSTAVHRTNSLPSEPFVSTPVSMPVASNQVTAQPVTGSPWPITQFSNMSSTIQSEVHPGSSSENADGMSRPDFGAAELNSAYEGALEDMPNGDTMANGFGNEILAWNWSGDLSWPEFIIGAGGN